jgi:hypothetical protein
MSTGSYSHAPFKSGKTLRDEEVARAHNQTLCRVKSVQTQHRHTTTWSRLLYRDNAYCLSPNGPGL